MHFLPNALPRWTSATLLFFLMAGCASNPPSAEVNFTTSDASASAPTAEPEPAAPTSNPADPWTMAINRATSAANMAQSAQSQDDWQLVGSRWQQAIDLLKTVPESHGQYAQAQSKITEYQRNLQISRDRADNPAPQPAPVEVVIAPRPVATSSPSTPSATAIARSNDNRPPEVVLANHLQQLRAVVYGTYWCSVCRWQEQQFGDEAFSLIEYVECDPAGTNPQVARCRQANVRGYPTWEVNGELYSPGGYRLSELADLTGYSGPRNFSR